MADARWVAVAGRQPGCPRAQLAELALESPQLSNFALDFRLALLDQIGHHPARRLARVAHAEHLAHLGEGQADGLGGANEGKTLGGLHAVFPVSRLRSCRLGQEAELLVIPQGAGRDTALACKFSDEHVRDDRRLTFKCARSSRLPTKRTQEVERMIGFEQTTRVRPAP